jgi:hypothetical protein
MAIYLYCARSGELPACVMVAITRPQWIELVASTHVSEAAKRRTGILSNHRNIRERSLRSLVWEFMRRLPWMAGSPCASPCKPDP